MTDKLIKVTVDKLYSNSNNGQMYILLPAQKIKRLLGIQTNTNLIDLIDLVRVEIVVKRKPK